MNRKLGLRLCIRLYDSKTCLKRLLKNRQKTKVLTNRSLMKVGNIAECSLGAFCNTFDLHSAINGLETQFFVVFEWSLKTGFTVRVQ